MFQINSTIAIKGLVPAIYHCAILLISPAVAQRTSWHPDTFLSLSLFDPRLVSNPKEAPHKTEVKPEICFIA
jgi:hypothetical protein